MHIPDSTALDALIRDHGEDLPLDRAAALLAAEEQEGVDADRILAALDALAAPIRLRPGASAYEAVARINHQLFGTLGFAGDQDDYYAPDNSFLDRVIERRRGLPILLSVVYVEVARRVGLEVGGVAFPGHFVVSPTPAEGEPRFYVDPFHGGTIRRADQLTARLRQMRFAPELDAGFLAPASSRQVLLRMTYNLKGSYVKLRDLSAALRQVDRVLLLAPERVEEHRDRALMLLELERFPEARRALEIYLAARPDAEDAEPLQHLLDELRG